MSRLTINHTGTATNHNGLETYKINNSQLIEKTIPDLQASLEAADAASSPGRTATRSVYGLCADLGEAHIAADIDETCREFLVNFPREDI